MEIENIKIIFHGHPLIPQVHKLRNEILRKPIGLVLKEDELKLEINDVNIIYTINDNDNLKVIGCTMLTHYGNLFKLRQMAVAAEFQGRQIGRKILEAAEEYAAKIGKEKIFLHARKTQIGFYLKFNYKIVSDEFIEVGIPHFKLEKELI